AEAERAARALREGTEKQGGARAPSITPSKDQEEEMNRDDLKKALEATSPEDLAALAPELFGKVVAAAKTEAEAQVKTARTEAATATAKVGELAASVQALTTKLEEQGALV